MGDVVILRLPGDSQGKGWAVPVGHWLACWATLPTQTGGVDGVVLKRMAAAARARGWNRTATVITNAVRELGAAGRCILTETTDGEKWVEPAEYRAPVGVARGVVGADLLPTVETTGGCDE
ncbi:MAG: hypothetical protein U0871_10920 [Gemmataceae bacterium]